MALLRSKEGNRETIHSGLSCGRSMDFAGINPWSINRGVSPFGGDSSLLEGTPPNNGTDVFILGQHFGFHEVKPFPG